MDSDFLNDRPGLLHAIDLMGRELQDAKPFPMPSQLPEAGLGSDAVLDALAPSILGRAARLGSSLSFAHMDPPTPWVTWATTQDKPHILLIEPQGTPNPGNADTAAARRVI